MVSAIAALFLAAAPAPARFALIVTYNGGPELSRPALHYADDDGAKYFEVFAALDKPDNVELLTEFDSDSARLFPALKKLAQPPTLDNVLSAAAALGKQVRTAKAQGFPTELTFVFAGHGDVEKGKGLIDLKGSALDGDGLTTVLAAVGADKSNVILDSCNSFFVLSPRGPGRRYATAAQVSERLSKEMTNVGVFLSTNAEAEVFEWSELQSGVFSHAVRSGLLGAADANGDGIVSYEELAAFVDRATQDVRNPLFRPKVFARGPGGNSGAGLSDLARSDLVTFTIDEPGEVRLSIRDGSGLRWIDAHKEAGATLTLRLPPFLAAEGTVERLPLDRWSNGGTTVAFADPQGVPLKLSELGHGAPSLLPRGDDEMLRSLFAEPFGPNAYQSFVVDQAAHPPQVFGIEIKEKERMKILLKEIASQGNGENLLNAGTNFVLGAALAAGTSAAVYASLQGASGSAVWLAPAEEIVLLGVPGAYLLGSGIYKLVVPSDEEKVYRRFTAELNNPSLTPDQVVANATEGLADIASWQRSKRKGLERTGWIIAGIGLSLAATVAGVEVAIAATGGSASQQTAWEGGGASAAIGVVGLGMAFYERNVESPTERLVRIWDTDPDRVEITGVGVAPVNGGAALALSGRF